MAIIVSEKETESELARETSLDAEKWHIVYWESLDYSKHEKLGMDLHRSWLYISKDQSE